MSAAAGEVRLTSTGPAASPTDTDTGTMATWVRRRLHDHAVVMQMMLGANAVEQTAAVAQQVIDTIRRHGKVIFFGNGGSAMDAGHLAAELVGRFRTNRPGLPAVSLCDATAAMTAIANDFGYDEVFARQLMALGRPGDVAIGLTTSGDSENVLRALELARAQRLYTVAMTGASGGAVAAVADICIQVPTSDTPRIQEACMVLGHALCEIVEQELFGEQ